MESDTWLGVELRHLAALQAIAEHGSFGRAAEALGYTQSAVSQQLATLEKLVGQRLVDRPGGPRPAELTEAGRMLLTHADAIVARLRAARADLSALAAGEAGALRVGAFQSAGARLLPQLLRRFSEAWPRVEVSLTEAEDDVLSRRSRRATSTWRSWCCRSRSAPIETTELLRDPYVLVTQTGSPLARRRTPPSFREIGRLPLVGYRSCIGARQVEARMRASGVEPTFAFRSDDNATIQEMVAAGMGVALIPRLTVNEADSRVTLVDLEGRMPPRLIGLAWHRDRYRPPVAEAFIEAARDLCRELEVAA